MNPQKDAVMVATPEPALYDENLYLLSLKHTDQITIDRLQGFTEFGVVIEKIGFSSIEELYTAVCETETNPTAVINQINTQVEHIARLTGPQNILRQDELQFLLLYSLCIFYNRKGEDFDKDKVGKVVKEMLLTQGSYAEYINAPEERLMSYYDDQNWLELLMTLSGIALTALRTNIADFIFPEKRLIDKDELDMIWDVYIAIHGSHVPLYSRLHESTSFMTNLTSRNIAYEKISHIFMHLPMLIDIFALRRPIENMDKLLDLKIKVVKMVKAFCQEMIKTYGLKGINMLTLEVIKQELMKPSSVEDITAAREKLNSAGRNPKLIAEVLEKLETEDPNSALYEFMDMLFSERNQREVTKLLEILQRYISLLVSDARQDDFLALAAEMAALGINESPSGYFSVIFGMMLDQEESTERTNILSIQSSNDLETPDKQAFGKLNRDQVSRVGIIVELIRRNLQTAQLNDGYLEALYLEHLWRNLNYFKTQQQVADEEAELRERYRVVEQ